MGVFYVKETKVVRNGEVMKGKMIYTLYLPCDRCVHVVNILLGIFCVVVSNRSEDRSVCACSICTCKCAVTFRRDQLQSIHHAKHYEDHVNKKRPKDKSIVPTADHSIIRELTSTITSTAADSILKVLQNNCSIKQELPSNQFIPYSTDLPTTGVDQYDQREIQLAIERSMGITALSLCKDNKIAGHVQLKNELRKELGGTPTTHLLSTNQSVSQHRNRRNYATGSKSKCSRTSRNILVDLCSSSDDESNDSKVWTKTNQKLKKRIMMKLLKLYQNESDGKKKKKMKYTMQALDDNNDIVKNEMIDLTFNVFSKDPDSFDSMEASLNMLNIADETDTPE